MALFYPIYQQGSKNPTTVPSLEPRDPKLGNFPDIQDAGGFEPFLDRIHADLGPIVGFWYGETYVISVGQGSLLKPLNHLFHRANVFFELVRPVIGSDAIQFANSSQGKILFLKILEKWFHGKYAERLWANLISYYRCRSTVNSSIREKEEGRLAELW